MNETTLTADEMFRIGHYYMDSKYHGLWVVKDRDDETMTAENVDSGERVIQLVTTGWTVDGYCEVTLDFVCADGVCVRLIASAERHVGDPGHVFAEFKNRHSYSRFALFFGTIVEKITARRRARAMEYGKVSEMELVKLKGSGYYHVYRDEDGDEVIYLGEYTLSARDEVPC